MPEKRLKAANAGFRERFFPALAWMVFSLGFSITLTGSEDGDIRICTAALQPL